MDNFNKCEKIRMAAPWAAVATIPLIIAQCAITVLILSENTLGLGFRIVISSPIWVFAIFQAFLWIREVTTVISITECEILLTKMGVTVERLNRNDICCIGRCSEYYRSSFIFFSTVTANTIDEGYGDKTCKENGNLGKLQLFAHYVNKNANKRNSGVIVITYTPQREKHIRGLFETQWLDLRRTGDVLREPY